jgi:Enoyl-(Acyl carrier protein) reductase
MIYVCANDLYVQFSEEALDRVLAVNTKSVASAFKYQLPAIKKSGGNGSMLVNSSCGGTRATANERLRDNGVCAASKAAASMLAQYAVSSLHDTIYEVHMHQPSSTTYGNDVVAFQIPFLRRSHAAASVYR